MQSCSKGTYNTGVVSPSGGLPKRNITKRNVSRNRHNRRGLAWKRKHFDGGAVQSEPVAVADDKQSANQEVDAAPDVPSPKREEEKSADQEVNPANEVPSPIPVRRQDASKIDFGSDDADSEANYSTCLENLNEVQDLHLSQEMSSPPGTPLNESKVSSNRSLAPTPPFAEDNDCESKDRGRDVFTDDEAEKEWAINEEREELGLAPIDFRSLKADSKLLLK